MTWGHDALAEDLASHLTKDGKAFAWTNIELPGCDGGRPDVLVFPRWRYHSPTLNAFEVKVSVADLERDLKAGKWSKYLGACSSVTFAMPTGLAKAADLPPGFGVMYRSERGWRTQRKPPAAAEKLATPAQMAKLLSSPRWRPQGGRSFDASGYYGQRILEAAERQALKEFGARFGETAARFVLAQAKGEDPAARAEARSKANLDAHADSLKRIRAELAEICELLGLDPARSDIYAIRRGVKELAARLTVDGENAALYRQLAYIRDTAGDALKLREHAKDRS